MCLKINCRSAFKRKYIVTKHKRSYLVADLPTATGNAVDLLIQVKSTASTDGKFFSADFRKK